MLLCHYYLQARGSAGWTPDKTSVGQAVRKLESLIKQLDSLLPYLSVAINAVNLLNTGASPTTPLTVPGNLLQPLLMLSLQSCRLLARACKAQKIHQIQEFCLLETLAINVFKSCRKGQLLYVVNLLGLASTYKQDFTASTTL